jgi:hypothetical protein
MPDAATEQDFDLGRSALLEITTADTVGANAGSIDEGDGVVSVHFATTLSGYPGWHWTVSIAHVDGLAPSVLETELTPGDGALLAPDWIPWVDRLADYRAAQDAAGLAAEELEAAGHEDDDDEDDDELDSDVLHGGDLDGVDIDGADEIDADEIDDEDEDDDLDDHIEDDDELVVPALGVDDADEAEHETGHTGP